MATPLRLLIIEDSKEDTLLLVKELERGGFLLTTRRVDTTDDLRQALTETSWDIVLSDYVMPQMNGLVALSIVRELNRDIPFIIITDKISDDLAVEVMKAGAQDYLRKGNLARLIPAINREVAEARIRREHRTREDQLRKLSKAVEQSSAMLLITDSKGFIEYVNPRFTQVTGYAAADVIGKKPRLLASGQTDPRLYEELWKIISAGGEWKGEFLNRRRSGELFWEDAGISCVRDPNGVITNYLKISQDSTEKRRMEEDLRRAKEAAESANLAKTQFLANMSHELRTPLNGILGMAELLMDRHKDSKEHDYAAIIHQSGSSLLQIISDILDLSKAEAHQLALQEEMFNLREIMTSVMQLVEGLAFRKKLSLQCEIDPELPMRLKGDSRRIRQILLSLASNAVKFTEKGNIRLSVKRRGSEGGAIQVLFAIEDTGIGISQENCDRLFRPFEQVDGSSTRKYGGMGVGLVLCQHLVHLMHGTIGVESRPGEGSTFRFTVPMVPAGAPEPAGRTPGKHSSETSIATGAGSGAPNRSRGRILVAEDDTVNRYLILSQLQTLGFEATAVTNGGAAVDAVRSGAFDLILMDCQMPGMDGFVATRTIRNEWPPHQPAIPIIAMTAHVATTDRELCFTAGMSDFLSKPFRLEQLKGMISTWLPEPDAPNP